MAKFEDMLYELALEAGKGSRWAEELRVSAIGFQPPRIADGVGGLDVPSISAGGAEFSNLSFMQHFATYNAADQPMGTSVFTAIDFGAADTPDTGNKTPLMKIDPSDTTHLIYHGWKWPATKAVINVTASWWSHATAGRRAVRLQCFNAADALIKEWRIGEQWAVNGAYLTVSGMSVVDRPAGAEYLQVAAWHDAGSDVNIVDMWVSGFRIF